MRFCIFLILLATASAFLSGKSARFFRRMSTKVLASSDAPSDTGTIYDDSMMTNKSPKGALMGDITLSRFELNEVILELEKKNPTADPARSDLLNGIWELTTSVGFTVPSLLIYQLLKAIPGGLVETSSVSIRISNDSPRVKASASVKIGGSFSADVSVATDITAVSGARLSESYKSGTIGTVEVPLSYAQSLLTRELLVVYLDEDLLVVRDYLGSPEILRRVGKVEDVTVINSEIITVN